jgi:hypothetical protein
MDPATLRAFSSYLEKTAISGALIARVLSRSGARVAPKIMKQVSGLSRASASPVSRMAVRGARESTALARASRALPQRVGLGQTARQTRARVAGAVRAETAAPHLARQARAAPLSKAYEGYMSTSRQPYTAQHVSRVMGISPAQAAQQGRRLGGPLGKPVAATGGTAATGAATPAAMASSGLRPTARARAQLGTAQTVMTPHSAMTGATQIARPAARPVARAV